MKRITLSPCIAFVLLLAFGLLGCATALPPSEAIARVPVVLEPGKGATVTAATIQVLNGHLYAKGGVQIADPRPGNSQIRVRVRLLDSTGQELALKWNSVPTHARTARVGQISPFWVELEPWPAGTAQVVVTAQFP